MSDGVEWPDVLKDVTIDALVALEDLVSLLERDTVSVGELVQAVEQASGDLGRLRAELHVLTGGSGV